MIGKEKFALAEQICSRISHAMRTPLGVALGVLDDCLNGYHLTDQDFSDAKASLLAIRRTLESLTPLCSSANLQIEEIELADYFSGHISDKFGVSGITEILVAKPAKSCRIAADYILLDRAFNSLLGYYLARESWHNATVAISFKLSGESGSDCVVMQVSKATLKNHTDLPDVDRMTLIEEASNDHSIAFLSLMFADLAFALSDLNPWVKRVPDTRLSIELSFPAESR